MSDSKVHTREFIRQVEEAVGKNIKDMTLKDVVFALKDVTVEDSAVKVVSEKERHKMIKDKILSRLR